jgi:serine protease AprX
MFTFGQSRILQRGFYHASCAIALVLPWGLRLPAALGALAIVAGPGHAARLTSAQRAHLLAHVRADRILADTDGNKLFDNLEVKLAAMRADEPREVIVHYKAGCEGAAACIAGRVSLRLPLDHSVVARLTREQIRQLAASNAVESIEADTICYPARDTSQASFGTTKASADFGLTGDADGDPNTYSPRDLTIAVIDTGIDAAHPDFAGGKIIAWKDFVKGRPTPYDEEGHGTHVASIAAGAVRNGIGGVAPGASLIGLQVFRRQADGKLIADSPDIARAIEWCIQNRERYGIDIINMSLSNPESSAGTDQLCREVDLATAAGLVVCVSAGNRGPDSYTIGSPSAAATAITVGSMADVGKGGFALEPYSSRGPTADDRVKPDICAPGAQILAARAKTGGYVRYSGTSMASPFVAGVAALMLQANPSLSPDQVKTILKETAVHFGPTGEPRPAGGSEAAANNEFGAGRLDGYAALAKVSGTVGTPPDVPCHLYADGHLAGEGQNEAWELPVDDLRFPLAVTVIMLDRDTDFDLFLYDPDGNLVATSDGEERQETTMVRPAKTGTYVLRVVSYAGAGRYWLDASEGLSQSSIKAATINDRPGIREYAWPMPR